MTSLASRTTLPFWLTRSHFFPCSISDGMSARKIAMVYGTGWVEVAEWLEDESGWLAGTTSDNERSVELSS